VSSDGNGLGGGGEREREREREGRALATAQRRKKYHDSLLNIHNSTGGFIHEQLLHD